MVSFAHMVAADGKYIAIVSTTVETANPLQEVSAGIALLGKILARLDDVSELKESLADGVNDHCFISRTYDATR
jgi:Rab GDP dissociation inhibitor